MLGKTESLLAIQPIAVGILSFTSSNTRSVIMQSSHLPFSQLLRTLPISTAHIKIVEIFLLLSLTIFTIVQP